MENLQGRVTNYERVVEAPLTADAYDVICDKCGTLIRSERLPIGTGVCVACFDLMKAILTAEARGFRMGV